MLSKLSSRFTLTAKNLIKYGLSRGLVAAWIIVGIGLLTPAIQAQVKPKVEEEIKVLYLGKWYDAEVIDVKGKEVLAEFVWIKTKQEVFPREKVRLLNEVGAMDYSRRWSSVNKTFSIVAALKEVTDDSVVLIKTNLKKVTVPLKKLSQKDNIYAKKMERRRQKDVVQGLIPDRVPDLPELEVFGFGVSSGRTFSGITPSNGKSLPGTPSYQKEFSQAGTAFSLIRKQQKLVAVVPVGGPEQLVLMTTREKSLGSEKFQSQAYWVSMKEAKVIAQVPLSPNCYPLDYDPRSKRLLTFHRKEYGQVEEDFYVMWEMKPGSDKCTPVQRWEGKGLGWSKTLFAKIVDKDHVIALTEKNNYEGWDLANQETTFVVKTSSFFGTRAVLSGSRRHLLVPEDKQVSVVDSISGEPVFSFPMTTGSCSGICLNSEGNKLAALSRTSLSVWDLESGSDEPTVYPAPLIGSPSASRIEWIGDDHILGQSPSSRVLYQLSNRLPVWSYKIDVGSYWTNRDPLKNFVLDGRIFYVARPETFGDRLALGIVDLPGPQVDEMTKDLDRSTLLTLKKDSKIVLKLDNVSDEQKVRKWLTEKIESVGWTLVSEGEEDFVMTATMGRGERTSSTYRQFGFRGKSVTVSYTPYFANLKIKRGSSYIWSSGASSGPPGSLKIDNAQAEVNKLQVPQLGFFERVKLEADVIDPKYSRGFGLSKLGLRGIQVVSTTPPGRADDPFAESEKANEDQRKSEADEEKDDAQGEGKSVSTFEK